MQTDIEFRTKSYSSADMSYSNNYKKARARNGDLYSMPYAQKGENCLYEKVEYCILLRTD